MTVIVDVQYAQGETLDEDAEVPLSGQFERWVAAALAGRRDAGEITVRVVAITEGAALNQAYRHRPGPTNVLSFPIDDSPPAEVPLLGDVVICAPLVNQEAREQHKASVAHWAHLTVHGSLHLLGYDHQDTVEAERMEALETEILAGLGYPDPYAGDRETRTAS